ncbi:alpha/beta fold hydrolase [Pseudonocardia asaccharolytica]|uniref:Esterase n=1 Tax=Pseudonocardia asaccharolytica DSM 44247 = NBRC 16224 TaxID=1123024 RepID=A0A511D9K2_9PSEU|nr:alpha/beta fold hydrolase [Pseudonocardia asaccharolytica]GEL19628.1 hypothetical protein PA7_34650 [Pseudonocardia asaccharolytica DSM 44247 = NBRC 16224]
MTSLVDPPLETVARPAPVSDGPLRFLLDYHTVNTVRSLAEVSRAAGTVWADALTRAGTPFDVATRGLRWWTAMLDRQAPNWHLDNEIVLSTPFAHLRDFTRDEHRTGRDAGVVPTLVLPPQAGHSSTVVDFSPRQSQLSVIQAAGLTRLYVLEWRPATRATRDITITDYLEVIDRSVRQIGGRANIIGDCQGGWLAAIYAALHPDRVHTLTLAGAPIDFHAGDSVIAASTIALTRAFGLAPYRALVGLGGGNMPGRAVLGNFIHIQPHSELSRQLQLLENIEDPAHLERYHHFEDWFKYTQDIPGAFYLWLVEHLFWRNQLISGALVVDGRRADLAAVTCPLFLLAGSTDHITPPPQVFAAADAVSTPREQITLRTAQGGHLGLFMGRDALAQDWPPMLEEIHRLSIP